MALAVGLQVRGSSTLVEPVFLEMTGTEGLVVSVALEHCSEYTEPARIDAVRPAVDVDIVVVVAVVEMVEECCL